MGHVANLRNARRRQKAIDDPLLNRLGLQVGRTLAAHAAVRVRARRRPADATVAGWAEQLAADGCVEVRDFLDADDFAAVVAAAHRALEPGGAPRDEVHDGANVIDVVWRHDVDEADRGDLDRFFHHPSVLALAAAAERTDVAPGAGRCVIQRLTQHDGAPDAQAAIHSDTFHPTHKVWLYLTDVREEDGPLVYHPGSNRLSPRALRGIYRDSVAGSDGSRRIDPDEAAARGLPEKVFLSPANTLVVADTFGYHGRIQGRPPGGRLALQVELRPEPFGRRRAMAEDRSVSGATQRARRPA